MKGFLILCLLFAVPRLFANDTVISEGLSTLLNPNRNLIPNHCPEESTVTPEWCADPHTQSCMLSPGSNGVENLEAEINQSVWANVSVDMSDSEIQEFSHRAITVGEAGVFERGLVSKSEFTALFEDSKNRLQESISRSTLSALAKGDMRRQVRETGLIMGTEFLSRIETDIRAESPEMSGIQAKYAAIDIYTETCGPSGLSVNAFNYNGSVVFCAGLLQTLQNFGGSKESIMNALSNIITHELAHSIDNTHHPEAYRALGACIEDINSAPGSWSEENAKEIVSDYWASEVLASRLAEQGNVGRDALPGFSLATVFLCDQSELPQGQITTGDHPHGRFRVNSVIAGNPRIRNLLSCSGPTVENPACMIEGRVPRAAR
jgi:hypothetical protein